MCKYLRFEPTLTITKILQHVNQMQFRKAKILRGSCDLYTMPKIVMLNTRWIIRFHALNSFGSAAFLGISRRSRQEWLHHTSCSYL